MAQNKKRKKAGKKSVKKQIKDMYQIKAFGLIALGILLALFMYVASDAPVNNFFKHLLLGLFGKPAYIVPALLFGNGVYYFNEKKKFAEKFEKFT